MLARTSGIAINETIGFIGCGKMAGALIDGLINTKTSCSDNIFSSNPSAPKRDEFKSKFGIKTFSDNLDVVRRSQVVVLSVKPNKVESVLSEFRNWLTKDHLLVSIVAGKSLSWIQERVDPEVKVARTIVNTPATVGEMAGAYCVNDVSTKKDEELVEQFMNSIGTCWKMDPELLDAVNGFIGSGPAYVFMFIESLADAAVKQGIPRDVALKMATQLVFGSAKMVKETQSHPAVLKDNVASPGGTTIYGIH